MEKLKQYKYIILIVIGILGLAFYWYEWRPSEIKKECYDIAVNKATEKAKEVRGVENGRFNKDDYTAYYKLCLERKGF